MPNTAKRTAMLRSYSLFAVRQDIRAAAGAVELVGRAARSRQWPSTTPPVACERAVSGPIQSSDRRSPAGHKRSPAPQIHSAPSTIFLAFDLADIVQGTDKWLSWHSTC